MDDGEMSRLCAPRSVFMKRECEIERRVDKGNVTLANARIALLHIVVEQVYCPSNNAKFTFRGSITAAVDKNIPDTTTGEKLVNWWV